MLTHANVTWNVVNLLTCANIHSDDVTVAITPFFRVGGTGVNVLPVLFMGGTVVIPDDASPEAILQAMQRHRVTVGSAIPTSSTRWPAARPGRTPTCPASASCSPAALRCPNASSARTWIAACRCCRATDYLRRRRVALLLDPASALAKIGSAGRPPLLVDVRIVARTETGVGPGETGELHVRGPNVMAGYWNQPEATRQGHDAGRLAADRRRGAQR